MNGPFGRASRVIKGLLSQGITPEKISLAIALAVVIGVFPVLGTTTALCAAAAMIFGLNPAAMQLVGWLVYPAQLALLVPMMRLGSLLFGLRPVPPLSELLHLMRADLWGAVKVFWPSTLSAVGAWLIASPVAVALIYFALLPPLRR
ncbi:MAG: DUF2062 domain-containing protein, partial [Acidobacteriota bacterium]|nr:DUF2062 domain-containing protein [Acidobacteriota bacterium]